MTVARKNSGQAIATCVFRYDDGFDRADDDPEHHCLHPYDCGQVQQGATEFDPLCLYIAFMR